MNSTIVHRCRGTKNFLDERERSQVYDELNSERSDLTIYDDWKEFEKHVEFVNNYFRPALKADRQIEKSGYFFMAPEDFPEKEEPFEGELSSDLNESELDEESDNNKKAEDKYGNPTDIYYDPPKDDDKTEIDSSSENKDVSKLLEREKLLVDNSGKNEN